MRLIRPQEHCFVLVKRSAVTAFKSVFVVFVTAVSFLSSNSCHSLSVVIRAKQLPGMVEGMMSSRESSLISRLELCSRAFFFFFFFFGKFFL